MKKIILFITFILILSNLTYAVQTEIFQTGIVRNATTNNLTDITANIYINFTNTSSGNLVYEQTQSNIHIDDGVYHVIFNAITNPRWFLYGLNFSIKVGSDSYTPKSLIPVPIAHASFVSNDSDYLGGVSASSYITTSFLNTNYPNRTEVRNMNGTWNADLLDNQDSSYYQQKLINSSNITCIGNQCFFNGTITSDTDTFNSTSDIWQAISNQTWDGRINTQTNFTIKSNCTGTDKVAGFWQNGTAICGADQTAGGSPFIAVDNIYIYNATGNITLNETKLNATIDLRDSDTTYSAGANITFVGTVISVASSLFTDLKNTFDRIYINNTFLDTNYYNKTQVDISFNALTNLTEQDINNSVGNLTQFRSTYPNLDTDSTNDLDLNTLQNETVIRRWNTTWITSNQNYNTSTEIAGVKVNNATHSDTSSSLLGTITESQISNIGTTLQTRADTSTNLSVLFSNSSNISCSYSNNSYNNNTKWSCFYNGSIGINTFNSTSDIWQAISNQTWDNKINTMPNLSRADVANAVGNWTKDSVNYPLSISLPNITFAQINASIGNHSQWLSTYPNVDTDSSNDLTLSALDNNSVVRSHNTSWLNLWYSTINYFTNANFTNQYDSITSRYSTANFSNDHTAGASGHSTFQTISDTSTNLSVLFSNSSNISCSYSNNSYNNNTKWSCFYNGSVGSSYSAGANITFVGTVISVSTTLYTDLKNTFDGVYQSIAGAFTNTNFTTQYYSQSDRFTNTNFSTQYYAQLDRFTNTNFTAQYDAQTGRYATGNFTAQHTASVAGHETFLTNKTEINQSKIFVYTNMTLYSEVFICYNSNCSHYTYVNVSGVRIDA